MRLESIRIRNLGPFRDAHLDVAGLPGPLVAVTGDNGAGKTTLLELFAGALFRDCPTRGSLASLATARDGMVEATVENGSRWTVRQLVDATSGKGEGVVLDASGEPVTQSGKVRELDAWVASHMPAPSVFYSTIFAAQGASGFLGMKPAERKSVLLRVLGIERLEQLAGRAREHRREAEAEARTLEARLADERSRGGSIEAIGAQLEQARDAAADADREAKEARADLDAARSILATSTQLYQAATVREKRRADLGAELRAIETRAANNRALLQDAALVRSAVDRARQLSLDIEAATERLTLAEREDAERRAQLSAAESARASARREVTALSDALGDVSARRDLAAQQPALRAEAEATKQALDAARAEQARWEDAASRGAGKRIEGLRETLTIIAAEPEDKHGHRFLAGEALSDDDRLAAECAEAPAKLLAARGEVATRFEVVCRCGDALRASEAAAARAEQDERNYDRFLEASQRATEADRAVTAALAALPPVGILAGLRANVTTLRAERVEVERIASRAEHLARAEERLAELGREDARLRVELEALGPVETPTPPSTTAVTSAEALLRSCESATRAALATVARLTEQLSAAEASAARVVELEAERATVAQTVADWTRLAADLGKDGLQAMEIDAAGPELTAIANDLLHSCHGSRWTVSIETQRLAADGKRLLEGCEVRVLDTERGRDAAAESLSGGERVIVGEAVSLALTTLACRRQGVERPTLVRDESGAALDAGNARVYVAMLRRAAELVRADKVLLVSHSPEVWGLCDSQVRVAVGGVESGGDNATS
jgi:DNA repair protein SbcC/Rad50